MKKQVESIPLDQWVENHPSEDDLRTVFINMDIALKYIHNHNYCVDVFHPTMIDVLNNQPNCIRFRKLIELSKNPDNRREMIREDIFRSAFIQIGIYSNCLKYLTPAFLKSNFDSFVQFIPASDLPYYRGIVQRNSSVYLSDYSLEKRKRELAELEKEVGGDGSSTTNQGKTMLKSNGKAVGFEVISNDKINDSIYRQINHLDEAAFVHILIIPSVILFTLFILSFISWIVSIFW